VQVSGFWEGREPCSERVELRALLGPECREAGFDEIARKQITSQGMGNYRYRTVFKPEAAILPGIDLHTSIYP